MYVVITMSCYMYIICDYIHGTVTVLQLLMSVSSVAIVRSMRESKVAVYKLAN